MSKKRLSKEAQRRVDIGTDMLATVLKQGAVPEIMIAARIVNRDTHQLDYIIASPLDRKQVVYILSRMLKLLDGSIAESN